MVNNIASNANKTSHFLHDVNSSTLKKNLSSVGVQVAVSFVSRCWWLYRLCRAREDRNKKVSWVMSHESWVDSRDVVWDVEWGVRTHEAVTVVTLTPTTTIAPVNNTSENWRHLFQYLWIIIIKTKGEKHKSHWVVYFSWHFFHRSSLLLYQ